MFVRLCSKSCCSGFWRRTKMKTDLLIVNAGNLLAIYQVLGGSAGITAIEQPTFPLLVATYARKHGLSVQVIDAPATELTYDEIGQKVKEINPTLVALFVYGYQPNASSQNMGPAQEIARAIK